jgi:hypothetical protein
VQCDAVNNYTTNPEKPFPDRSLLLNIRIVAITRYPAIRKADWIIHPAGFNEFNGGNRTPIELFVAGVDGWEVATALLFRSLAMPYCGF